ncbi:hypothetical protein HPP92_013390 [Vanilla planifolia]|uniref:Uncharacterized protein n=1 Tax=Vanilla planifolia TaxID=51239 RepID=A0A835QUT9_VANPL|nr:hypothetical protein HPP92_013390 [Vanilla planifolia]
MVVQPRRRKTGPATGPAAKGAVFRSYKASQSLPKPQATQQVLSVQSPGPTSLTVAIQQSYALPIVVLWIQFKLNHR